jgi:hypothetical protein
VSEPQGAGEAEDDQQRPEVAEQEVLEHVGPEPPVEGGCVGSDHHGDPED